MARLILSLESNVLAEYNMSKERYTIGRLPDNDVRIDNPTISGYHSLIINILNDSFLEDLNSTNGTYVNGKLIKKHALQHGDVVTVGKHQLRYIDSDAEEMEQDDEFARTMVIGASDDFNPGAPPRDTGVSATSGTNGASANGSAITAANVPMDQGTMPRDPSAKPLAVAKVQVLNGQFSGREVALSKAVTTLGRPGAQVIAITRRGVGHNIVLVENAADRDPPTVNGTELAASARLLADNDVIEIIGIKMGFFVD
jgi:predicted component of type VI protein secretion system